MLDYFEQDLTVILNKTKGYWTGVKNKTIFITGGTGFFGIWLQMSFIFINKHLNLNSRIIVLTRDKDKFFIKCPWLYKYPEISFLEGDITNFKFVDEKIDYIIHAATEASVKLNLEEPLAMYKTIVSGTERVLELARVKEVRSFLFTSSGAVYGRQPSEIEKIKETYNGAPIPSETGSVYGEGKRMAEVLCAVYHKNYQVPVKIARCYAFIGPFLPLDSHFAAGNFMNDVLNRQNITIEGDGTPLRSYMYIADLMVWLWTILFAGESNIPYNVGSDNSVSIAELANMISKLEDENGAKIIIKSLRSDRPLQRYVPDVARAVERLNLGIYTDLQTSLYKTFKFNKKMLG